MYYQNVCVGIMETWSSTYACEFTVFKFLWTNIFARDIREIDTKEIDLSKVKMHWVNGKFAGTDKNARLIRDIETSEFETTRFHSTIKLTFQQ